MLGEAVEIYADSRKAADCHVCGQGLVYAQTTRDKIVAFKVGASCFDHRLHTTNGRLIWKMRLADVHECPQVSKL